MGIDGSYLFIAGEIGIGIFFIMSRLTDTFDRIWDFVYPKVVFIIFSGLIPLMIWSFFAQYAAYQKDYSKPSWYERIVAQDKIMMNEAIKELESQELQPLQEKEEDLPPQTYSHGDNDFDIPLQHLLEGNHGRFL
ncbi:uncharacterized protein METZ01_LOCUS133018 [marine metagenome]|uniref:Uncharacterized protein n=1 Tax=marine metagenome TaxID=408172 RepID=A0A381YT82_9ZZZZ